MLHKIMLLPVPFILRGLVEFLIRPHSRITIELLNSDAGPDMTLSYTVNSNVCSVAFMSYVYTGYLMTKSQEEEG